MEKLEVAKPDALKRPGEKGDEVAKPDALKLPGEKDKGFFLSPSPSLAARLLAPQPSPSPVPADDVPAWMQTMGGANPFGANPCNPKCDDGELGHPPAGSEAAVAAASPTPTTARKR